MSNQHEAFSVDRHVSIENYVDPHGRKWEIHGERGSALLHARPNPDRVDAVIPAEFSGKWTKKEDLMSRIKLYLNKEWDKVEAKNKPLSHIEARSKITPEESLAALDPEIVAELGDVLQEVTDAPDDEKGEDSEATE